MNALEIILVGALGSALQELLHWYSLREHLRKDRYKKLITSVPYWVVTGLMILGSGVAVWLWFSDDGNVPARQYLVLGAALPLIFKKAVDAITAPAKTDVMSRGCVPREPCTTALKTYFGAGEERLT
jgi:hypothetical protein